MVQAYIAKFKYGEIKVDSASIDNFWLEGASKIKTFKV